VDETIRNIHTANIHHHDLRLDNIVRGMDGELRIIDFGHSSPADECEAAELCPDQIFGSDEPRMLLPNLFAGLYLQYFCIWWIIHAKRVSLRA
jgi:serine/threonine protein kinase